MAQVRVAIIGCGQIALQNHFPGIRLHPEGEVVALCDTDASAVDRAARDWDVAITAIDPQELFVRDDIDAVVIATPNVTHVPLARAALEAGKHVLCEKPIAMTAPEARDLAEAADAAGRRHMTAFTYRFVPAYRYVAHRVKQGDLGALVHFRAQRFQDWGDRFLGWRQQKALCATGELGDMLSHRLDFALHLMGPVNRLAASMKNFLPERGGRPSDVDDWVAVLCEFASGATGVLESTKLASGVGEGARSHDRCEVNGTQATATYTLARPFEIEWGMRGGAALGTEAVPPVFRVWPGSPRDPQDGDPLIAFRYDQGFEFIDAIVNQRPCEPSFREGFEAQLFIDRTVAAAEAGGWVSFQE
ncbi:MAG: Gfo/Idh/MocA family protein [Opitutales bacterium]